MRQDLRIDLLKELEGLGFRDTSVVWAENRKKRMTAIFGDGSQTLLVFANALAALSCITAKHTRSSVGSTERQSELFTGFRDLTGQLRCIDGIKAIFRQPGGKAIETDLSSEWGHTGCHFHWDNPFVW